MIKLTISIATANNKQLVLDCLRSIYENIEDIATEVYVVINDSPDDSEDAIRKNFPEVRIIANDRKLGFTTNHNMVMRRSKSEYILVLNDDTIILNGALKKMVDYMDVSNDVGILGCRILNPDGSLQWSCGKSFNHKFAHFKSGILQAIIPFLLRNNDYRTLTEVSWVTGACQLVRSKAILEVGVFDEKFIIYYEDTDWCLRMIKAGWKTVYFPDAEIIHYLGKTREKNLVRDLNIIYESRYYFFRKHYGLFAYMLVRSLTVIEIILHNIQCLGVFAMGGEKRRSKAKKSLKAYWIILWRAFGLQLGTRC